MGDSDTPPLLNYKWYHSYQVPIDVQVGISRLELPLDLKVTNPLGKIMNKNLLSHEMLYTLFPPHDHSMIY